MYQDACIWMKCAKLFMRRGSSTLESEVMAACRTIVENTTSRNPKRNSKRIQRH